MTNEVALVLFGSLLLFFFLKVPIAFAIRLSSVLTLTLFTRQPLQVVPPRLFTATDSFPFMAVPFFILSGSLMEQGGISRRLIALASSFLGACHGGLGMVSIVACMFFAAISGSSAATTAAIGSIMIPAMVSHGYDVGFASAINAASGTIGIIIPPSIPFVTYAVLTGSSVASMFLGGMVPGLLMGLSLIALTYGISYKRSYKDEQKATWHARWVAFKNSILALFMPIIVIGGIYSGFFTPTEAAVVAVVYALAVGVLVYRELTLKTIMKVFTESAVSTAGILFLIAAASLFGWILTNNRIPDAIAQWLMSISKNPIIILMLINLLLLSVGTFLDTVAALIILVPILFPISAQLGIDPVHFGLIICVNLAIGQVTPPFGICLFVACGVADIKLERIVKSVLPFILMLILDVILVTYLPCLSTWLPNALM